MKRFLLVLASSVMILTGCTETTRLTKPKLSLTSQPERNLSPRILFTIADDEAADRGQDFARSMATRICAAHPGAFRYLPSVAAPPPGQVLVTMRIRQLGGYFNRTRFSRLRQPVATPESNEQDMEDWGNVVVSATTGQPMIAGQVGTYLITPGLYHGWSGIAHIDFKINDARPGHSLEAQFSIAAERSALNTFGFATAALTAAEAWGIVNPAINRFLLAASNKVSRDQSLSGSAQPGPAGTCMGAV